MKLDIKGLQKLSSDEHTTTLRHPHGHVIKIAHGALSQKMKNDLAELPHYASGGTVEEQEPKSYVPIIDRLFPAPQISPDAMASAQLSQEIAMKRGQDNAAQTKATADATAQQEKIASSQNLAKEWESKVAEAQKLGVPVPQTPGNVQQAQQLLALQPPAATDSPAPASTGAPAVGAPQPPQGSAIGGDPYGAQVSANQYMKGLGAEKAGIAQQAQGESNLAKAEAEAESQKAQTLQSSLNTYEQNHAVLQKERDALVNDIQNGHIDPERYVNNMTTGHKIRTAIGLIISGLGSGGSHQENMADRYLRDSIDHDIDSQKAELGKKQNLLSMNLQKFQDFQSATSMTKAMQMDITAAKVRQAGLQSQDPIIKGRALQAAGKLDMESAQIVGNMAARKTLLQGVQNGTANAGAVIRSIVPESHQAAAYKELKESQDMIRAKDNIMGAFEQVGKLNTLGNALTSPIQTSRQVAALTGPLTASLSKETAGRFSEADAHFLGTLWPAKGDSDQTIAQKHSAINKLVSEKMNFPLLQSYGINPSAGARFNGSGEKKIQLGPPKI